jgi:hypothetical protein
VTINSSGGATLESAGAMHLKGALVDVNGTLVT